MAQDKNPITILVVDDDKLETSGIRSFLEKNVKQVFKVHHCTSLQKALNFLRKETVDIVLFDFHVVKKQSAEKVLEKVNRLIGNTPLIIFSGEKDHDTALLLIKEGVVQGNITREYFAVKPDCLRDAIECAIAMVDYRVKSDSLASAEVKRNEALSLKLNQEHEASMLELFQKKTAETLKEHERLTAIALKESNARHLLDIEYQKQLLSWINGGYPNESVNKDVADGEDKVMQEKAAVKLLHDQEQEATDLKLQQKKQAKILKEDHEKEAVEVKGSPQDKAT